MCYYYVFCGHYEFGCFGVLGLLDMGDCLLGFTGFAFVSWWVACLCFVAFGFGLI